jgi:hypothetical protein
MIIETNKKPIIQIALIATVLLVINALVEISLSFFPGGSATTTTVEEWISLLETNTFMALRNLGLLNIIFLALGIPFVYGVYICLNPKYKYVAQLALIIQIVATAYFFATNRVLAIYELFQQYELSSGIEKEYLLSSLKSFLLVGESHNLSTSLVFIFGGVAGIIFSSLVFLSNIIRKPFAVLGIIGYSFLTLFEILNQFVPEESFFLIMMFAALGGIAQIMYQIGLIIGFAKMNQKEVK